MQISHWKELAQLPEYLVAVKVALCDRPYVLRLFQQWGQELGLPVYFINPGYRQMQRVEPSAQLIPAQFAGEMNHLGAIAQLREPGIFLVEGILSTLSPPDLKFQVSNAHFDLAQAQCQQFIVLIDDAFDIPLALYPLVPLLEYSFPSRVETQQHIAQFCQQQGFQIAVEAQRPIVQACIGLPRGEIDRLLVRSVGQAIDTTSLTQQILEYKRDKLRGRGINLLPKPDVAVAAGMELLDETLEKIRLLLQPEAESRNLRSPRALLLWGIPGSGKSLAAKLSAQRIGATLISCDWNGLLGATVRESMDNLDYLLRFCSEIGTAILFFDEFEKAFSGWRSDAEGGVLGKLAGRLLSWMQDHVEPVVMIATINHLDMLPAEMIRRFDYIHFFGMPHAGALYEVFNVHLQKYFRYEFTELQWRILLREYRGCTPDEVGKAVHRVAHRIYFRDMNAGEFCPELPTVTLEDLVAERQEFTPASNQQSISDQLAAILNKARYAKPVAGKDTSIFASPPQKLLGMDENSRVQPIVPPRITRRVCPAIEEI
jgi:ATPase family associated with various cellular activities (AAA)